LAPFRLHPLWGLLFRGSRFRHLRVCLCENGLKKHPELRDLLPRFMSSEDGRQGLFGAATFAAIAAVAHWAGITVFGAAGIAAILVKLFVYFVLLLGLTQGAQAFDGFVIRPLISSASQGDDEREALAKRVRQVGAIIASVLAALAAIATVDDVTLR
jgi:hypothetical protein